MQQSNKVIDTIRKKFKTSTSLRFLRNIVVKLYKPKMNKSKQWNNISWETVQGALVIPVERYPVGN